jgi:putative transposase
MGKKHYSQSIKDEAVLFYELGHSFAETQAKYGMAESTFFTWKQKFDKAHLVHAAITTNRATSHKSKRHLEKLALELEVLRQCPCGRNASIDEKVAAVNALCGRYSIHVLCDALSLPRGTYYNRKRREGQRTSYEINDEKLKPLIRQIFHDSKNRFGRKPIHHKLAELGYKVSEKRIVRLMKEMGLSVAKPCYKAEHQKSLPRAYFRNLLARQFDQPQPNLIWVSDITYIKVLDQYYYICVVLDLFSRRILSYSISDSINTALTLAAFDDAFQSRNPPQDLLFHSDQGAQYTSYIFRAHLKELHIKQSFSTPGTPYDNSVCESFFHTLKKEALYHHLYGTPQELQAVLDEYINFYNSQRPHRKLNMKTPNQYESAFYSGCL